MEISAIPFKERQSKYMIPLKNVGGEMPFNFRISFFNGNLIRKDPTSTPYPINDMTKEMSNLFQLEDWQIETDITGKICILHPDIYDNLDVLTQAMQTYGWRLVSTGKAVIVDNQCWNTATFIQQKIS